MQNIGPEIKKILEQKDYKERLKEIQAEALSDPDVQAFIDQHQDQVDEPMIQRSLSKIYEFVQEKKRIQAGYEPKIPNFHPQLQMNVNYIDVQYVANEDYLAKQAELKRDRRITLVGLPKSLREANFDQFDVDDPARQEAASRALTFTTDYLKAPDRFHKGLYFHGAFGVGKTFLLAAIANDLADKGYETTLVHYPQFAQSIKQSIASNTVQDKLEALQKAPLLMLDDIGAESNSAWLRDDILGVILQYRMNEQLPTFFSSNFNFEELETHLARTNSGDIEPVKAGRIMERIAFLAEEIEVGGRNRRHD
ncbi:primosomal protein DnaI [Aerococcus sanguinicola]|uniref:primosomal protein DnaI n=1 Tax=Aerococcus sanguinicola TaxID=119206 RepID=UPI002550AC97|nr:primosomal protein DnaI [Aerococcus sanguinicola]MDK7049370.1 primosomal protein DnaI [Aerococcus sanguinicola]